MLERVDLGELDYDEASARMAGWVKERREGLAGDRLFLLSHPPVITYGSRTSPDDLPADLGIRTVEVDRGGFASTTGRRSWSDTWSRTSAAAVRWTSCGGWRTASSRRWTGSGSPPSGVTPRRGPPAWSASGRPEHHKVASIGMRIRHGITSHGFALNVDPDMTAFDTFTVCGLHDVTMTSLRRMAGERPLPSDAEIRDVLAEVLIERSTSWIR